ncbi:Alpha-(1,3)-fucosyltransferase 10 [Eumeta japonica]|uniref:Fucosyltransferase n=1 Tax=Eumeta variegata TaxID=151549 RepID=A0A4C1U1P8_EUMVA|nr:Alpha-(1,3)-fucosyltransferase 10 [Eumeta japonica]
MILWWTKGFPQTSSTRICGNDVKCDIVSNRSVTSKYKVQAYLFYGSNIDFEDLPLPRKAKDNIWGLFHEESPRNVERLMHEPILKLFNFSSTFSRYSDVPFPLQHLFSLPEITSKQYFVETSKKNALLAEIAPIMYIQSDCETSTERDAYVKELMKYIKIDSYGTCLNNIKLDEKFQVDYLNHLNDDDFLNFIARYKFVIAIENGVCEDYVTEKLWRALKIGTVPIYFGSPSVKDWLPNEKSAILLQNHNTPQKLKEHIDDLLKNDTMYEQYLEHKIKQVIKNKNLIFEFHKRPWAADALQTAQEFECYICEKVHENLQGKIHKAHHLTKKHYDCPKPVSALTLDVNPENSWVFSWQTARVQAEELYKKIVNEH